MTDLNELADLCEMASGPDRELDCLIWIAVGEELGAAWNPKGRDPIKPSEIVHGRWMGSAFEKYPMDPGGIANSWRVPFLTESLDAAMMLKPDGWTWDVDATVPEMGVDWTLHEPVPDGTRIKGTSEMPVLALCAAALRARAATPVQVNEVVG